MSQQLLDLFRHECEFSNYIATGNEITVANLQSFSSQFSHIYGETLSGKTHLLKAWVNLANQKYHNGIYLDVKTERSAEYLAALNIDEFRFIAVDNIDYLQEEQQIELFNLFNHIKLNQKNNYLLTSSTINLNFSTLRSDLKTRIHSGLVFALKNLTEDELLNALTIYCNRESIGIGNNELKYMLTHYTRNLGLLIKQIQNISQTATIEKRPITTHFIRQLMANSV